MLCHLDAKLNRPRSEKKNSKVGKKTRWKTESCNKQKHLEHSSLIFYFCLLKFSPKVILGTMIKKNVYFVSNKKTSPDFQDQSNKKAIDHSFMFYEVRSNLKNFRALKNNQNRKRTSFFFMGEKIVLSVFLIYLSPKLSYWCCVFVSFVVES